MLRITAKINIGDDGGIIDSVSSGTSNTTYSSTIQSTVGHHTQIQRPFIFGRSRLGGGQCFTKKANFYIGNRACDSNGDFGAPYIFTINGVHITRVTIIFNKQLGQYPKSINVDGDLFYDDDPQWTIPLASANTHTITISNWNTPNMPMVISSIYADLSIDINDTNLLKFERIIMEKSDYIKPSFGIISNSGSMSFVDKDGEVLDLISQRLVNSNNIISIYLENTNNGKNEQIGYFNSRQWSYRNSQSIVDVTLKDDLEEWQSINVPAINYVPTVSTSQTAEWLYKELYNQTPKKYKMLSFDKLDYITKEILSGTTVQYPVLDNDNLWAQWTKLCELCFLNIYKDNSGRTICIYSGG